MESSELQKIFGQSEATLEDGDLYPRIFTYLSKKRKEMKELSLLEKICTEEFDSFSKRLDRSMIQESTRVRNVIRTRNLATFLVNEEGAIQYSVIPKMIETLKRSLYSTGPKREGDAKRNERIVQMLEFIQGDKKVQNILNSIEKPYSLPHADQIIRHTLQLSSRTVVTDGHAKRAVIAALLCFLRQTVGSCFATAPAILIQSEQPKQFIRDVLELLQTGRLKRTFAGEEYAVPLSYSWGAGDLKKRFQLYKIMEQNTCEIWLSPGIMLAMETVGILDPENSLPSKSEKIKEMLGRYLHQSSPSTQVYVTSAEELLRAFLLQHLELTEHDIQEYLSRPREMVQSDLLLSVPQKSKGKKGKGALCRAFLQDFEEAKIAFKSVADNALLKSWEFTLASFTEVKANFSKWNLYTSLGMSANDRNGIGECLYQILQQKLDVENEEVKKYQGQYEQVYGALKFAEGRFKRASSEKEARWMRAEYQSRLNEFRSVEEMRNKAHRRAESFANLFDVLIDMYLKLFPQYFQEIYDADMHEVSGDMYDDSPAGFQLVYKHGRTNTSQWTIIDSPGEFINSLTSFFIATENQIVHDPVMEGYEDDLVEIISKIISHIKSEEFIISSFYRMAAAQNAPMIADPLNNLDRIQKKPWSYTSGGSMATLIGCYFRREEKPSEESRWVENPAELLVFLIDCIKRSPKKVLEPFDMNPETSMLMHSPTHAFLFKPGYEKVKECWKSDLYTYTYIRDHLIKPRAQFVDHYLEMDGEKIAFLLDILIKNTPKDFHSSLRNAFSYHPRRMNAIQFREYGLKAVASDNQLRNVQKFYLTPPQIDSILYSYLPLFHRDELSPIMEKVFGELNDHISASMLMQTFHQLSDAVQPTSIISAKGIRNLCKSTVCMFLSQTSTPNNIHLMIDHACQKHRVSMPRPIIFADTNWEKEMFAYVVNPGTGEFELWVVNDTGTEGHPMYQWMKWLDGSNKEPDWGLYTKPHEYMY